MTGELTDEEAGGPGTLLVETGDNLSGSLPRADLAMLCVEAVLNPDGRGLVFEVVSGVQGGNYPQCS
jgi:hypothetical protein